MMCQASKVIEIARNEVGYHEKASNSKLYDKNANSGSANWTKYGYEIDTKWPTFYNGKKNGYAWCDQFVDWCFLTAFGYDNAKRLLCQPDKSAGAGCKYSMQYYKNEGQLFDNPKVGDQIFFSYKTGEISHTGLVFKVDKDYVYTYEGNSNNGVCEKKYLLNNYSIVGYGRPEYDSEDTSTTSENDNKNKKEEEVYKLDVLKLGKTGNDVTIFETIMKKMGLYNGTIDEYFGNGCLDACNAFQTKYPECGTNGQPDGSFGHKSWDKALSLLK